jgi:hypothetical protein
VALKALMTALNRNRVVDGDMADKRASIVDSQGAFEWGSPVDRKQNYAEHRCPDFHNTSAPFSLSNSSVGCRNSESVTLSQTGTASNILFKTIHFLLYFVKVYKNAFVVAFLKIHLSKMRFITFFLDCSFGRLKFNLTIFLLLISFLPSE